MSLRAVHKVIVTHYIVDYGSYVRIVENSTNGFGTGKAQATSDEDE
jgi:hypothetical protein